MWLSSIFVVLPFYAKKTVWKAWDGDDMMCAIAWVSVIGYGVGAIIATYYGAGLHYQQLDDSQVQSMLEALWPVSIFYVFAVLIVKVLLLRLLIRFFSLREKLALLIGSFAQSCSRWVLRNTQRLTNRTLAITLRLGSPGIL